MARLVILLAILAAVLLLLRWFSRTPPERVLQQVRRGALWGAIAAVLVLAATGRLNWVFALLAAAVPVVQRLLTLLQVVPLLRRAWTTLRGTVPGAAPGQPRTSTVTSRFLRMALDHDTGTLSGTVLEGPYRGRELAGLALSELLELLARCRAEDAQSAALLEAYLDRVHGQGWRNLAGAPGDDAAPPSGGKMTRQQACEILGVTPAASADEVRAAHRRLMQRIHPDRGGSTYLASLINQAKDVLLQERGA